MHRTGFKGMLPFFNQNPFMMGRMPHEPSDFEENSGGLFRHSEGMFQRIQKMFEKHNDIPNGDDLESRPHFHHKEHQSHHTVEEIKKLKKDHE